MHSTAQFRFIVGLRVKHNKARECQRCGVFCMCVIHATMEMGTIFTCEMYLCNYGGGDARMHGALQECFWCDVELSNPGRGLFSEPNYMVVN